MLEMFLIKDKFNLITLVTCKFLKQVTIIEHINIQLGKKCVHIFLKHLNLIN